MNHTEDSEGPYWCMGDGEILLPFSMTHASTLFRSLHLTYQYVGVFQACLFVASYIPFQFLFYSLALQFFLLYTLAFQLINYDLKPTMNSVNFELLNTFILPCFKSHICVAEVQIGVDNDCEHNYIIYDVYAEQIIMIIYFGCEIIHLFMKAMTMHM